jgi:hypothetical protein
MHIDYQAAQTLGSHLRAQGYLATVNNATVTLKLRRRQVTLSTGDSYGPQTVSSADLRSADPGDVQRALDWVKKIAGLRTRPHSVYRRVAPKRSSLGDDFDDILFRTKIFSRCPNPSPEDLAQWRPRIRQISRKIWGRFRRPLLAFGFEAEDLETYGLVHLTTALHRYRTGRQEYDEAVISRYVTQRLTEIVKKVQRKGLHCSADSEVRSWAELRD